MAIALNGELDPAAVDRTLDQARSLRVEVRRLRYQLSHGTVDRHDIATGLGSIDELLDGLTVMLEDFDDVE